MIRHIVSWKLAADDEAGKDAGFAAITAALTPLPQTIPELLEIRVGRNVANPGANWDVVLVADYASLGDLQAYQVHPDHQAAAAIVRQHTTDRVTVDFEV